MSYYRQKTESLLHEMSKSTPAKTSMPAKSLKPCPIVHKPPDESIQDELCQMRYVTFVNIVDQVYYQSIIDHFGSWHDPSAPLVSDIKIEALVCLFEKSFPITSSFLHIASNSERSMKTLGSTYYMKKFITYQHFLSMCRLRNKNNLTWWAMVEGLSYVARGLSKVVTTHSVMCRLYTCPLTSLCVSLV